VPPQYLTQMFGWGVAEAIATYQKAKDDPRLLGALLLFGSTPWIIDRYEVRDGKAFGYDEKGEEVVRVPLREPIILREIYDEQHDVLRTNIT
jgi:nitrate reductase / nitrite oxidoreductase, beta subunit